MPVMPRNKWISFNIHFFKNTNAWITHGSVSRINDRAMKKDRPAELRGHIRLGIGELGLARRLGHEELALVLVEDQWLWNSESFLFSLFATERFR